MADSFREASWFHAALLRAVVAGTAMGAVSLAGAQVVAGPAGPIGRDATAMVATVLVAFAIGIWAGAPEAEREHARMRERWLSAAALTAVAGSYATFSGLYQQVYPGAWWRAGALLLGLGLPLYALGLLTPVLVAWADRLHEADPEAAEGWGGLGPVVMGLFAGAAGGVLLAGLVALPRLGSGSVLMMTAFLLLIPLALRDPRGTELRETVIFETVSAYGSLRVTQVAFPGERQPERRLYLNDEEESGELVRSGAPTLAYVAAAESWLSAITPSGASFLFLGGGAYTLPRRIAERDPQARIVVVERDPEVTRLAYRYFGLAPHHAITSVHGDGRAYLSGEPGLSFDRIYLDVYGGREALPYSLVTREAALVLRDRLAPDGVAAMNLIGTTVGPEARQLWSVVHTFADVFASVALYVHLGRDFPERQNLLLAGSPDPDLRFPGRAGHFEPWAPSEWPQVEGVVTFRDVGPTIEPAEGAPRPAGPRAVWGRERRT
jgi:hypothetical protein